MTVIAGSPSPWARHLTRLAALAALISLAACNYAFRNPAEQLGPGEVAGRTVVGAELLVDGVAVSVKNGGLDATSRQNGRFAMLPLPVGRHTLLFRKGPDRVLQREVEIRWGKDGQPEGLWLGDVLVPGAVELRGVAAPPPGVALSDNGVAMDEVSGAAVPVSADGVFSFGGLSIGEHRIGVFASAQGGQAYVGGPATVWLGPADAGTVKQLSRLPLHPAEAAPAVPARVRLRLAVAGRVPGLDIGQAQIAGLPSPVTLASDGSAQVEVPEGLWTVGVRLPGALREVTAPPPVSFVAVAGEVIDLGTLYAVSDLAADQAQRSCHADADCGAQRCDPSGRTCLAWTPPAVASASAPWCKEARVACTPGEPIGIWHQASRAYGPPFTRACIAQSPTVNLDVACGSCCTPDGVQVVCATLGTGGCPALPGSTGVTVSGTVSGAGGGAVLLQVGGGSSATADGLGHYTLSGLAPGVYTVTPSLAGFTFVPASRVVEVGTSDVSGVDFLGQPASGSWQSGQIGDDYAGLWGTGPADVWAVGSLNGTIVHFDGARWQPARLAWWAPQPLYAVWGSGTSDVWAVGAGGLVVRWDGVAWSQPDAYTTSSALYGLWGSARNDLWAVGAAGTILHGNGIGWNTVASPVAVELDAVWGSGPNDLWAVGQQGTILHGDGSTWTVVANQLSAPLANLGGTGLYGVWGSAANDVWAVGDNRMVVHWDGSTWSASTANVNWVGLRAVWGTDARNVYAVGVDQSDGGTQQIGHWDGTTWSSSDSPVQNDLYSIWGAGNDVWVGGRGILLHLGAATAPPLAYSISGTVTGRDVAGVTVTLSGATSATTQTDATGAYTFAGLAPGGYTVTPTLAGDFFLPESRQVSLDWNDGPGQDFSSAPVIWIPTTGAAPAPMTAAYGTAADDIWAVGGAAILHWDGAAWSQAAVAPNGVVKGVWASARDDVWAVGFTWYSQGLRMHWDGLAWSTELITPVFSTIWGSARDDVYAFGWNAPCSSCEAYVFHFDGTAWTQRTLPYFAAYDAAWGSSATDIWAVGTGGAALHLVDGSWVQVATGTSANFHGIWGSGADDVWVVGDGGTILHWNGVAWTSLTPITTQALTSVWGSAAGDVWASAGYNTMLHWDGATWTNVPIATTSGLGALWGSSAAGFWMFDDQGTALHTAAAPVVLHAISGTVTGAGAGVLVTLSGAGSATAFTDAGGAYAFTGLVDGSYVVTPSLATYSFGPSWRAVAVHGSDVAGLDFAAVAALSGSAEKVVRAGGHTYVAGSILNGTRKVPCYWVDGVRHDLAGDGVHDASANGIALDGAAVLVSGWWSDASGLTYPALWTDGVRTDLTPRNASYKAYTTDVAVAGGAAYLSGSSFDAAGGQPCLWSGSVAGGFTRTDLPGDLSPGTPADATAQAVAVDGGVVYATGWVRNGYSPIPSLYTGGVRDTLPLNGDWGFSAGLRVVGGVPYTTATQFLPAGHYVPVILVGPGASAVRTELAGDGVHDAVARGVEVVGATPYVAGAWSDGTVARACYWKGSTRIDLPGTSPLPAGTIPWPAAGIAVDGRSVYVAGHTSNDAGGVKPVLWVDGVRSDLL